MNLNQLLVPLSKYCDPPLIARIQGEQAKIRLVIARMQSIRDTDFLAPAYALLHNLLIVASVAMLTTYTDDFGTNLIVTGFLFTSFMYLLLLIYDLDNPFEYNGTSSAAIDLSSLEQAYNDRVRVQCQVMSFKYLCNLLLAGAGQGKSSELVPSN